MALTTSFSNIYRDTDTNVGNNQRPIMAVVATVLRTLAPGTYWVEWRMRGSLVSGPWAPPITILGQTNRDVRRLRLPPRGPDATCVEAIEVGAWSPRPARTSGSPRRKSRAERNQGSTAFNQITQNVSPRIVRFGLRLGF